SLGGRMSIQSRSRRCVETCPAIGIEKPRVRSESTGQGVVRNGNPQLTHAEKRLEYVTRVERVIPRAARISGVRPGAVRALTAHHKADEPPGQLADLPGWTDVRRPCEEPCRECGDIQNSSSVRFRIGNRSTILDERLIELARQELCRR